jgi:hypothetical protein
MNADQLAKLIKANTHSLSQDDVQFQIKLPDENRFVQLEIANYRHYGSEKRLVIDLKVKE